MPRAPELKAFYDGFADQHWKIVETLRPLSAEQMQLQAAPSEWAIWQLASNMVGGRMYWLCFMLGEDNQGIGPEWTDWEDTPEHSRTSAELIEALEKTWVVVEACFDRWTLADLNVEITKDNFWGQPVTISPAWVLQRVMAHEVHPGSEISLMLRVHGLPTLMNR